MTDLRFLLAISGVILLSIFACSQPDPQWTMRTPIATDSLELPDTAMAAIDTAKVVKEEINVSLDKAEGFYSIGVHYFQVSQLDSAQAAYEQALAILSDIDIDPDQSPEEATRMDGLLNEIEEDYRLTLVASGTLSSEASVAAFRELFSDLKNFKKLKESGIVKEFNKADSVIYDIDIEWNEKVENSLIYLQTVAREKFTTFLARSQAYLPLMEKIFKEKGLPHDLVYLPLIESGFNSSAYSYARASGFWQFISSTGRLYGLEHNWWFDERRDFEKSTRAAAAHLKDLYDMFGSWNLALAAYNAGSGRVTREIKRSKTNDYWKLNLHPQTKTYVPLFMAATIIAKQPHKYGFFPEYAEAIEFDTVSVTKCLSFNNISAKTGFAVADLERLNPELLKGITPPNVPSYRLRIPKGKAEEFAAVYNDIPSERATSMAQHKVRKGETLYSIAKKYGTTVTSLVQANELSKKKRLVAGQVLIVPVPSGKGTAPPEKVVVADRTKKNQSVVREGARRYLVKEGDTLWEIAAAYGVSISGLKRLNDLPSSVVYAGRWLKIPERPADAQVTEAQVTYEIYRVKRGDNLTLIAGKFKVSPQSIKAANNLQSSKLYPGMSLKIPSRTIGAAQATGQRVQADKKTDTKVYTVRRGDTLWKIAKAHGVELSDLAKWNKLTPRSRLIPGDKLKIYL